MAKIKINANYAAIHAWVRKYKPKPEFCEFCNKNKPREIAKISKEYTRNIDDYAWVCHSCHMIFDKVNLNLGDYLKGKSGQKNPNYKGGKQLLTCDYCHREFYEYKSQRKRGSILCSFLCSQRFNYGKAIRDSKTGRFK